VPHVKAFLLIFKRFLESNKMVTITVGLLSAFLAGTSSFQAVPSFHNHAQGPVVARFIQHDHNKAFDSRTTSTSGEAPLTELWGKKKKGGGGGGGGSGGYKKQSQAPQEKQSVKDQRFDAQTRQFMFTMLGLNKVLPDKSKTLLKNINLCFYPGAKIGVVGLNGSGKSTMLKIMAGLDKEFEGTARPLPGASIGYLPQEPMLEFETVQECIDAAVKSSRDFLEEYNELSVKLADPDLGDDEMNELMGKLGTMGDEIEAKNLWDLDRTVERAMDALRLPPGDAQTAVLSGGEKRRVTLCQLLLGNHDMLLLDEPTNHLDAESISWLEQFLAQFAGTVVCITHDRYFLENIAQWILELDRGEGIPFEGNYSDWLEHKQKRFEGEKKAETAASKAVQAELEWVRSSPKARSTKSKARLNRYDELLSAAAPKELVSQGQIYIPPGPRLGDVVIDTKGVQKAFGDRLLMKGLDFSLPQAGIVGVIGPNGAGES
jgi:sulfate-transporting ATPase